MHSEALAFVARTARQLGPFRSVVDLGGLNVNGSLRNLFSGAHYVSVDIRHGRDVDIVADAATWMPDLAYELALCTEVLEHTPKWRDILDTMATAAPLAIITAACHPRAPHSGHDGGPLRQGEYYANVDPELLFKELESHFDSVEVTTHPRGDVYAVASK